MTQIMTPKCAKKTHQKREIIQDETTMAAQLAVTLQKKGTSILG